MFGSKKIDLRCDRVKIFHMKDMVSLALLSSVLCSPVCLPKAPHASPLPKGICGSEEPHPAPMFHFSSPLCSLSPLNLQMM